MNLNKRKIVTAFAWGLAFQSVAEMSVAGAFGGWAGLKASKRFLADLTTPREDIGFSKAFGILSLVGFLLGASLGLLGCLPGTEDG